MLFYMQDIPTVSKEKNLSKVNSNGATNMPKERDTALSVNTLIGLLVQKPMKDRNSKK